MMMNLFSLISVVLVALFGGSVFLMMGTMITAKIIRRYPSDVVAGLFGVLGAITALGIAFYFQWLPVVS